MALSVNSRPHFTTIAYFISSMDQQIVHLLLEVLLVCDQQRGFREKGSEDGAGNQADAC
ncbi:MAG: hypothetical protein WBB23_25900 [Desulforhopalus sp.]